MKMSGASAVRGVADIRALHIVGTIDLPGVLGERAQRGDGIHRLVGALQSVGTPDSPADGNHRSCSVWSALRERDRTIATLDGEVEKRKELRPPSAAVMADDPRAR